MVSPVRQALAGTSSKLNDTIPPRFCMGNVLRLKTLASFRSTRCQVVVWYTGPRVCVAYRSASAGLDVDRRQQRTRNRRMRADVCEKRRPAAPTLEWKLEHGRESF